MPYKRNSPKVSKTAKANTLSYLVWISDLGDIIEENETNRNNIVKKSQRTESGKNNIYEPGNHTYVLVVSQQELGS